MRIIARIMAALAVAIALYWLFDLTRNKVHYTDNSAWAEHSSSPFVFARVIGGYASGKLKPTQCRIKADAELGQRIRELISEDQGVREDGFSQETAAPIQLKTDTFLKDVILADTGFDLSLIHI